MSDRYLHDRKGVIVGDILTVRTTSLRQLGDAS